jgi:hypothetical protein
MILKTASLETSRFGNPQPTMTFTHHGSLNYRLIHAEMYSMAAKIELASMPSKGQWAVVVNTGSNTVHLELMTGSPEEVKQAMAALASAL